MKLFIKEYECNNVIYLNINYRCSKSIIEAAQTLISNNSFRISKIQTAGSEHKDNGFVRIIRCINEYKEAEYVCSKLRELSDKGADLDKTAIIFRTYSCINILIEKMKAEGIPFNVNATGGSYYLSEWILDIVSYLNLSDSINNESYFKDNRDSLFRILNKPERHLLREIIIENNGLHNCPEAGYKELYIKLKLVSKMNCYGAIVYILKGLGYESYFRNYMNIRGYSKETVDGMINELLEISKNYTSIREWLNYIETVSLANTSDNGFHLLTAHASKGLEYETVFVVGLQDGIFPHVRSENQNLLEEERRLMYVAMTRAKKYLYLVGRGADKYGKRISMFISELENQITCKLDKNEV